MKTRLTELKRDRGYKLNTLQTSLRHSIEMGYDFVSPNLNIIGQLLQLESQIRELEYFVALGEK